MVTVEKSKKGKEKIMEPKNQVVSKWEELVVLVDEGVMNMKLMRDILEAFKGKMEIYAQICGMGCVEEKKSPIEIKQGNSGANNQVGPANYSGFRDSWPPCRHPTKGYSKTYYRKRHKAVAVWRVKRRMRRAQQEPEVSLEINRSCVQESSLAVGKNFDLESPENKMPAREEGLAREKEPATGGGRLMEEWQASGNATEAI
jgi:hypothetical protein